MNNLLTHDSTQTYTVQRQRENDRIYMVVPVVMMVEGVHSGSLGPLLHYASELAKSTDMWNGVPITIRHPQDSSGNFISANSAGVQPIGMVQNARMEDTKLKADAWLDEALLLEVNPVLHANITAGKPLEVSIGVFTTEEETPGEWNGEQYNAIARNHVPDHLALLPDEVGACSWKDGCGVRVNQSSVNVNRKSNDMTEEEIKQEKEQRIAQLVQLNTNAQGFNELLNKIQRRLDTQDSETQWHSLEEAYDGYFIYRKVVRDAGTSTYHRQAYQIGADGDVEFVGEASVVRKEVSYVQVNAEATTLKRTKPVNNTVKKGGDMSKEEKPCCLEKVVSLIANKRTRFTAADKEWLLEQGPEILELLEPMDIQVNADQAAEVIKKSYTTAEEFISLMPKEMQAQMQNGLKLHNDHRSALMKSIQANAENVFSAEELEAMDVPMLEKIEAASRKTDYSAAGDFGRTIVQTNAGEMEVLLPPVARRK